MPHLDRRELLAASAAASGAVLVAGAATAAPATAGDIPAARPRRVRALPRHPDYSLARFRRALGREFTAGSMTLRVDHLLPINAGEGRPTLKEGAFAAILTLVDGDPFPGGTIEVDLPGGRSFPLFVTRVEKRGHDSVHYAAVVNRHVPEGAR